jgi:hypothetical protein
MPWASATWVGAAVVVGGHGATVGGLHAGGLESEPLDPRREPEGRQHLVGLEDLRLAAVGGGHGHPDAVTGVLDVLDLGLEQDVHAQLLVVLEELLGHVGVLGGHHPVEELHDRDVDAEVLHDVGELDADRAGATDDHAGRQVLVEDLLLVGHDVLADLHARQHPHGRPGGQDQVVERVAGGGAVVALDVDPGVAGEGAPPVDLGDLVLLHQVVDALDDALAHLAAARVGRAVLHRRVALDAELVALVRERVGELGVLEERLGRDAADVEADTAPVLLLHDRDLLAQLGRSDRGDVAAGAGAEDQDIEVVVAHEGQPSDRCRGRLMGLPPR